MTSQYVFSATTLAFYPLAIIEDYEKSGTWPADAVPVENEVYLEFLTAPHGKTRGVDSEGFPTWVDIPPSTSEELTAAASHKQSMLLAEASAMIAPLKDASDGGYIDDDDKPRLVAWQKYRYALTKVDAAKPEWPEKPAT